MLAIAARLLGEARLAGAFPTGEAALAPSAARIASELADDEHLVLTGDDWLRFPLDDFKVLLGEPEADSLSVSCHYGRRSVGGRLRIDGVLDEQSYGFGVSFDDPEGRIELPPLEQEVMKRAFARRHEAGGGERVVFRGDEFLRALPVEPQPGAAAQVLAVELYGDGLVVHHTYDDPVDVRPRIPFEFYDLAGLEPPIEELLAEAEAEGGNLSPNISLTDDLGTDYIGGLVGEGGVEVRHGESHFTPAVPDAATRLIVSSYAATVEVRL